MKFLYPVPPSSRVTQTFAEHEHRREVNGWTHYNGGIDWSVPTGTPIRAAQAGTVVEVRSDATGYGTHVRIEHVDGNTKYLTIYGHLMEIRVSTGDPVEAGEIIGKSDNTGFSSGPHLHFELRKGIQPIDPAPLLVQKARELKKSTTRPSVPLDTGVEPLEFPNLPRACILVAALNIRSGPGLDHRITGTLTMDEQVEVIRKIDQGQSIWLQIGHHAYIAMLHEDDILARWA